MEEVPRLNVETCRSGSYRQFIQNLRQLVSSGMMTHQCLILRPEQNPIQFQDIILETNRHEIRFRIRQHNLYLDGYRVLGNNPWMEFQHQSGGSLISESTSLGFNGGYTALERRASPGLDNRQAALPRLGLPLGLNALANAVDVLAVAGDDDGGTQRARKLIVIIQMISEATRFDSILDRVCTRSSVIPDNEMEARENCWGPVCERLLRADADPNHPFRLPEETCKKTGIKCAEDAYKAIGVILCFHFIRRVRRDVRANDEGSQIGRKMVEVFAVRINDIDGEDPGDLYGTITVNDGLGSQYIYCRSRTNIQSIRPGEYALLIGPTRHISAHGSFTISLNLMDRDGDPSPDDEVSKGQIWWNGYELTGNNVVWDKLKNDEVTGEYGSATVVYAILSNAVSVDVRITLIDGDGEDPANVYGLVTASNSKIMADSVLFSKTEDEYIDISPGSLIPLSRSVVAVPLNSTLKVRARLYDQDTFSSDDEIANGIAGFNITEICGSSEKRIKGEYGEISVKVSWDI